MTADTLGGVWDYAVSLARAHADAGFEVVLASLGPAPDRRRRAALGDVRLVVTPHRPLWMQAGWRDREAAGAALRELAAACAADVAHLNDWSGAAGAWPCPRLVVAHSCVTTWWRAVHRRDPPAAWHPYRTAVAEAVRAADLVVAPTRAMRDALAACYGAPRQCAVIPNGRDPAHHPPGRKLPIVLGAGRLWDEAKNAAALARAARRCSWPVLLAGPARHPGGGSAPALEGARLLGPLPSADLAFWMGRAAVFAHPARYEPFGLCVLEAALAGCALVLGDIDSLRESWNGAAEFVPCDDDGALARSLERLARDPSRLAARAAAAALRGRAYPVSHMAARYRRAYEALGAPQPCSESA